MLIFPRSIPPPSRHHPAFSRHSDHTHVPSAISVTPPEAISHTRRTRAYRMRFSMAGCGRQSPSRTNGTTGIMIKAQPGFLSGATAAFKFLVSAGYVSVSAG